MRDKTQGQCRDDFYELVLSVIEKIDEIDDETPWSVGEPKWWLSMMKTRRELYRMKEELFKDKG